MPGFFSESSQIRLQNLINQDNNVELAFGEDYTLGPVQEYSDEDGRNTLVTMIAPEGSEFGNSDIKYTRLPISELLVQEDGEITEIQVDAFPFSIHDILPKINEAFKCELTEDEVLNETYTEEQEAGYPLTVVAGSYGWLPSSVSIPITVGPADDDENANPDEDDDNPEGEG